MNHSSLNSELLSGEARTRKNVPIAVFAVIFIHIVLFVLLLIAAGCRARLKAQQETAPDTGVAQEMVEPAAPVTTPEPGERPDSDTVLASEPPMETESTSRPQAAVSAEETLGTPEDEISAALNKDRIYIVKPGDSLWLIARRHGTTVKALKKVNNLKDDSLQTGQKLKVDFSTSFRAQKT